MARQSHNGCIQLLLSCSASSTPSVLTSYYAHSPTSLCLTCTCTAPSKRREELLFMSGQPNSPVSLSPDRFFCLTSVYSIQRLARVFPSNRMSTAPQLHKISIIEVQRAIDMAVVETTKLGLAGAEKAA